MSRACPVDSPPMEVPGVPNTSDTIHQCSMEKGHKSDVHYCGCGHSW